MVPSWPSFAPEFTEASLLSGRRQHAMLLLAAARACLSSPAPPPRPQTRAAPLSPLHRRRSTATLPRPARIPLLRPLGATAGAGASSRPARDRVIEFGKHKGQMLGTLPPSYLRWVVADLDYGDTLVWAREVLDDPVYVDRVEWQHAHSFLRGDSKFDYVYDDGDGPLQEMAERFGWDLSDEDGWAASTSASSAPPTVAASRGRPTGARAPAAAATDPPAAADPDGPRGKRDERRERTRTRREEQVRTAKLDVLGAKDGHGGIWFVGPTGQICA